MYISYNFSARYGTLAGNAMDSLLRRMNALYMPTFLGNKQCAFAHTHARMHT